MRQLWRIVALFLVAGVVAGCGGAGPTGKFSNHDKPKPVDEADK